MAFKMDATFLLFKSISTDLRYQQSINSEWICDKQLNAKYE